MILVAKPTTLHRRAQVGTAGVEQPWEQSLLSIAGSRRPNGAAGRNEKVEFGFIVAIAAGAAACQDLLLPRDSTLIGRAKSLELDSPYVPPPGEPLEHHTAGFAKILCSAVFLTGLSPEFATEN